MGRGRCSAIYWPNPKQDLRPFRLCRLACRGRRHSQVRERHRRLEAETTGDEIYSESKPKPRARPPGCSAEGSGAGWAEPTTLAALTATMETPASKIVRNRKKPEPPRIQDPMMRLIGSQRGRLMSPGYEIHSLARYSM